MAAQQAAQISLSDVELPDNLTPEDVQRINATLSKPDVSPQDIQSINATLTKAYQQANPSKKQPPVKSWVGRAVDTAVDLLPKAGAIAGGTAAGLGGSAFLGPGGYVAGAVGAGLGGAIGESAKQTINALRGSGPLKTPSEAVGAIGTEGAWDTGEMLVTGGVLKGAGLAGDAVGPAASAVGRRLVAKSATTAVKDLSNAASVLGSIFGHLPGGYAVRHAPEVGEAVGRGMQAAGAAMTSKATGAGVAPVLSAAQRAAQIPLKERLAQIPLQEVSDAWTAAKAAQPGTSLADDVLMVRGLVAKGFNPAVAVKVASGADASYADSLTKAWTQSLKAKGAPIPESALAVSGKVSPAVTELMNSPTFQALAQSLKARTP